MVANKLWTEAYRPTTIDEYVFKDNTQKNKVSEWVKNKDMPHCLFSGSPGTGKTSLAKILIKELNIHEYDVLEINASRTNSIDDVRNTIVNFVQMMPFGGFKVVLLDEADFLSVNSQAALRGLLEEYHTTARFIFTCNLPNRILPALHSRCQGFHIEKLDVNEFTARVATILLTENIEFDLDILDTYVKATYPDLRKCINSIQQNSIGGKLELLVDNSNSIDYRLEMVELFKKGKIQEARKLICSQARPEEMEEIFSWMYKNIDIFSNDETVQDRIILIIKDGLVGHTMVSDPEINMSATLIRIRHAVKK
jgi:replication factor C small subunit